MQTPLEPLLHAAGARITARGTPAAAGTLDGLPVLVKDGFSLLVDAAEEIGLHLSEKIEQREHGQRRVAPGRSGRRLKVEEINAYLEKSRRPPDSDVRAALVRDLLRRARQAGDSLGHDRTSAQTPTDHYLLLQQALQTALAEAAPSGVIERLEQALANLEATAGLQIFADLATIDQASSFGETAHAVASFQSSVYAVLGKPTLVQAFSEALALAEKDGRRLDSAVLHLMDAVGTCLYALAAWQDKALLRTLVKDLYHLKCLNTVFSQAKFVVRNVRKSLRNGVPAGEPGHVTAP